ncbi:MAG: c-type cytochrome [Verrucomicrobia bacterium]|nr:c-type cytochrome [Verrucomicrobiota bacterium]
MSQEPKRGDFAKKKGEIILREHEFDGIQEFDQKLPNWWLFTFFAAIAFFVAYWFFYYATPWVKSPQKTINDQIIAIQEAKLAELAKTVASLNDSKLVHSWKDQVPAGEAIYVKNCLQCHAADLSAMKSDPISGKMVSAGGRPLTDHVWEHGGKPMQMFKLINEGTPPGKPGFNGAKMEAWGQKLSPVEIAQVISYIISKVPEDFKDIPPPEPEEKK